MTVRVVASLKFKSSISTLIQHTQLDLYLTSKLTIKVLDLTTISMQQRIFYFAISSRFQDPVICRIRLYVLEANFNLKRPLKYQLKWSSNRVWNPDYSMPPTRCNKHRYKSENWKLTKPYREGIRHIIIRYIRQKRWNQITFKSKLIANLLRTFKTTYL